MAETTRVPVEKVVLERLRMGAQVHLTGHALHSLQVDVENDPSLRAMVYSLTTEVFSQKLGEETNKQTKIVEFDFPSNWWQQLKLANLPEWVMRKWPVKYRTFTQKVEFTSTFKAYHKYPEMKAVLPPDSGPAVLHIFNDSWMQELVAEPSAGGDYGPSAGPHYEPREDNGRTN